MTGTTCPMMEHHFPENFNLRQWHCDNLKSCMITVYYTVTDNKPNVCQSQDSPNFHKIYNKTGPVTFRSYFILTTHQSHRDCKLPNGTTISRSIISKNNDKETPSYGFLHIRNQNREKDSCSCTARSSHNAI